MKEMSRYAIEPGVGKGGVLDLHRDGENWQSQNERFFV